MEPLNAVSEDLTEIVKNSYDDQKIFLTASEFLIASKGCIIWLKNFYHVVAERNCLELL